MWGLQVKTHFGVHPMFEHRFAGSVMQARIHCFRHDSHLKQVMLCACVCVCVYFTESLSKIKLFYLCCCSESLDNAHRLYRTLASLLLRSICVFKQGCGFVSSESRFGKKCVVWCLNDFRPIPHHPHLFLLYNVFLDTQFVYSPYILAWTDGSNEAHKFLI